MMVARQANYLVIIILYFDWGMLITGKGMREGSLVLVKFCCLI